jgi:hypothetical protein
MMSRRRLVPLLCSAVGLAAMMLVGRSYAFLAEHTEVKAARSADSPPDLLQPRLHRIPHDTGCYRGVVSAVDPQWLELGPGWEGVTGRRKQLDHNNPKRISALGTKPGGDPNGEGTYPTHRVSDLKVGDIVVVEPDISRGGEEWATVITIERRPGGKIPPMEGDRLVGTPRARHMQNQAYQDWEEKGIPILGTYLDPDGRAPWTNPPYPPVAPQPRPAKP